MYRRSYFSKILKVWFHRILLWSHLAGIVFTVDIFEDDVGPHHFCYHLPNCGPSNEEYWPGDCQSGENQSPINLVIPEKDKAQEKVEVPLFHLKTDHFFMQNNGRTISVDFVNDNEFGDSYFFPGYGLEDTRYRLSNVHFHWGRNDSVGSEHTVDGKSYSMEVHLLHYNAEYSSPIEAVGSGDKNALAVVGIFLQVNPKASPHPSLAPIVKNIKYIEEVHKVWWKVEDTLDLTPLMPKPGVKVYSYKGSLTTPFCNEQVNWHLFKDPISISSSDVATFRSVLDSTKRQIFENHRPVQPVFNRIITVRTMAEKEGRDEHMETTTKKPKKRCKRGTKKPDDKHPKKPCRRMRKKQEAKRKEKEKFDFGVKVQEERKKRFSKRIMVNESIEDMLMMFL